MQLKPLLTPFIIVLLLLSSKTLWTTNVTGSVALALLDQLAQLAPLDLQDLQDPKALLHLHSTPPATLSATTFRMLPKQI
jgi:hypothetical protein